MSQTDPFAPDEFDAWAESYDRDIESQARFPFAGYEQVLDTMLMLAASEPGMAILDIGTGTGNLALRFAENGCQVWGTDFSEAMLAKAREKLPRAHFVQHDLRQPWPTELDRRFACIVSAYMFHHFETEEKARLCKILVNERLAPGGKLLIGDLSFANEVAMHVFARSVGELWEQEHYWLADECIPALESVGLAVSYTQVSTCAGVYRVAVNPTPEPSSKKGGE